MPLNLNLIEIIIHMITIIIIVIIIRIFIYKPVKKKIEEKLEEERLNSLKLTTNLENAKNNELESINTLNKVKSGANQISKEIIEKAESKALKLIEEAKKEAVKIIEDASMEVKIKNDLNIEKMKHAVSDVSIELASQILNREITKQDLEEEIEEIIKEWKNEEANC